VAVGGLVDLGHQPGERAHTSEVGEAVEVAETTQDAGGQGHAQARGRQDDAFRVNLVVEAFDPGVQPADLVPKGADDPDLRGDVGSELGEIQAAAGPQAQCLVGSGQQLVRLGLGEMPSAHPSD